MISVDSLCLKTHCHYYIIPLPSILRVVLTNISDTTNNSARVHRPSRWDQVVVSVLFLCCFSLRTIHGFIKKEA